MSELRLYAIINKEALAASGGARGKMMAQAGHAFLHTVWDAETRDPLGVWQYQNSAAAVKIVLAAESEAELRHLHQCIIEDLPMVGRNLVTDAARTVFKEPTVTFLGIGPITQEEAPQWLKDLRPLQ